MWTTFWLPSHWKRLKLSRVGFCFRHSILGHGLLLQLPRLHRRIRIMFKSVLMCQYTQIQEDILYKQHFDFQNRFRFLNTIHKLGIQHKTHQQRTGDWPLAGFALGLPVPARSARTELRDQSGGPGYQSNYLTLTRVIHTVTHYSDVVSDISSGSIYGTYILTFYLTFFPAHTLTFSFVACTQTFYLASILTYFPAYILTFYLASFLALYLTSILTICLTFFLTCLLTFFLTLTCSDMF